MGFIGMETVWYRFIEQNGNVWPFINRKNYKQYCEYYTSKRAFDWCVTNEMSLPYFE